MIFCCNCSRVSFLCEDKFSCLYFPHLLYCTFLVLSSFIVYLHFLFRHIQTMFCKTKLLWAWRSLSSVLVRRAQHFDRPCGNFIPKTLSTFIAVYLIDLARGSKAVMHSHAQPKVIFQTLLNPPCPAPPPDQSYPRTRPVAQLNSAVTQLSTRRYSWQQTTPSDRRPTGLTMLNTHTRSPVNINPFNVTDEICRLQHLPTLVKKKRVPPGSNQSRTIRTLPWQCRYEVNAF
jgi:hypothetical protein